MQYETLDVISTSPQQSGPDPC